MKHNFTPLQTLIKREIRRYTIVATQTLLPPIISSLLFMFVFGLSIGSRLSIQQNSLSYLEFMIPGLIAMHLIEGSFTNSSSSLFISRWHNLIQELLLSPISYLEMVLGLLVGSISRALLVAAGVFAVSRIFVPNIYIHDPLMLLIAALLITSTLSCLGLLAGLCAESFENLSVWGTFALSPMIYFGGVFHSIDMVPHALKFLSYLNPIFYMVNLIRYAITGQSDLPIIICLSISILLATSSFILIEFLFRKGYKLRK